MNDFDPINSGIAVAESANLDTSNESTYALSLKCERCLEQFDVNSGDIQPVGQMPVCPACQTNAEVIIDDVAPPVEYQPWTASTALVRIHNVSIETSLPDEIVSKITDEVKVVKIGQPDAQKIVDRYETALSELNVGDIIRRIMANVVTDSSQKEAMADAHRDRMLLVKVRKVIEDIRTDEKQESQNRVAFVDGTGRGIRRACEEAEAFAKHQEEFKKREDAKRHEARLVARKEQLAPFMITTDPHIHGIADMTDEAFTGVLEQQRIVHFQRIAENRRIELAKYEYTEPVAGLGYMTDESFASFLNVAKIKFEQAQEEAANRHRKREERIKQLSQIGMKFDGTRFVYDALVIDDVQISAKDDVDFANIIASYGATIIEREREKAAVRVQNQALEDKRVQRINRISALGFAFHAASASYVWDNGDGESSISLSQSEVVGDGFEARIAELLPAIEGRQTRRAMADKLVADARLEEQRKAAETERLRLAPDKEKLTAYFKAVHDSATDSRPKLISPEADALCERFFDALANLVNAHATEADKLGSDVPF